jgi:putative ABC transport system ATP-binding protein
MSAPPSPAPPGSRAIDIRDLEFGWARGEPLLAIDRLQIAPGERVFLTGSSGSGKSTLLGLIAGVLSPRAGEVRVAGTTIHALAPGARDRFRGAHIGFIFQMFNLIPYLDVLANVLLPLRFSRERRARIGAATPAAEALRLLDALGIADVARSGRPVAQLSIGQQQRVAAARALIGRPELLLADEPTSSLDASARADFLRLLMDECRANGSAVLFVSHDPALSAHFDRVIALADLNRASPEPSGATPCRP